MIEFRRRWARAVLLSLGAMTWSVHSAEPASNARLREYWRSRVESRAQKDPCRSVTKESWPEHKETWRNELRQMLGLDPWPERGALSPVITGQVERAGIVVEKLHFQSSPGLYVTANFYRPKDAEGPLPTILYLCGHARVVENGVAYGNKVGYQHHGAWFARNGYNCLTIDTVQLGEITGLHHGTYRLGMWWWIARGYTPAGVEAWNAIRALDYLETRPEVDQAKIGVTGRSGGGIYSWWLAALDDRPACFVPVAGITDLEDYVVHDCIEGHCDCMFMVNRKGWDFGTVACLVAPRPCLFSNSDKDGIFPLDGVERVHRQVREVYRTLGAEDKLGLLITEGPHKDTQDLQVPAFRWFNRWLKGKDEPIAMVAEKLFEPAELKVFAELPSDEHNSTIHEEFVPSASAPSPPTDLAGWDTMKENWLQALERECFASWPKEIGPTDIDPPADRDGVLTFTSEPGIRVAVRVKSAEPPIRRLVLHVLEESASLSDVSSERPTEGEAWAYVEPRASGADRWAGDERSQTHFRRRFVLFGTTLDEGRVWDARQALAAVRQAGFDAPEIVLAGKGQAAGLALYAGIFEEDVDAVELEDLPSTHRDGPIFMNVLKVLNMPQAVALAFPRRVKLIGAREDAWSWTRQVADLFRADAGVLEFMNSVEP